MNLVLKGGVNVIVVCCVWVKLVLKGGVNVIVVCCVCKTST